MTDTPSQPLTDQTLARLRKLANGNGLNPEKIQLLGAEEKIYTLSGTLTLTPKFDAQTGRYPGPAKAGKGRKVLSDAGSLKQEVDHRKEQFLEGRGWIDACLKELKTAANEGWGLDGAHITLPEQSIILAASSSCPSCHGQQLVTCQQCRGQRTIPCQHCQGRRQELCYGCNGTGQNPQQPDQRCTICQGSRYITCRHCRGSGQIACPSCHGKGGTPCPPCQGTGLVSEDVAITCGAETHFKLKGEGLPSGLRRGLDRLGIINLGKGHADIITVQIAKSDDAPAPSAPPAEQGNKEKIATHDIGFEATLPYADLRMNFDGHKALVSAFGKKGALLGVPNFLDDALKPARDTLALAATGAGPFEDALNARAINEALQLELNAKGTPQELRRLYSVGLSQDAMREILGNLRLALKRQTLKTRSVVAVLCCIISSLLFAGIFTTSFHSGLTTNWPPLAQFILDFIILLVPLGLSWFAMNLATRLTLQRKFKNHAIAMRQTTGKTFYTAFATIILLYLGILATTPAKPFWLLEFVAKPLQSLTHS